MQGFALRKGKLQYYLSNDDFLSIDLTSQSLLDRAKQGKKNNLFIKALAIGEKTKTVLDLTAGLGQDSFVMACFGAKVLAVERNPIMHLLLKDAHERAAKNLSTKSTMDCIELIRGDSIEIINELVAKYEVDAIYIDPMYPERKKSALGKKSLRLIHNIVGEDLDSDLLLKNSLKTNLRVVVKRPKLAECLQDSQPSLSMTGKSTRYDIYLPRTQN